MLTELRQKIYEVDDEAASFGTIAQIQEWMKKNDIPDDALVCYAGCGTHNIMFSWMVDVPEFMELSNYD